MVMSILAERTSLTQNLDKINSLFDVSFFPDTFSPITTNDIQKTVASKGNDLYTISYAIPQYEETPFFIAEIQKNGEDKFSLKSVICRTSDYIDSINTMSVEGDKGLKEIEENAYTGPYEMTALFLDGVEKVGNRGFDVPIEHLHISYENISPELGFNSIGNPDKITMFAPTIKNAVDFIERVSYDTKPFPLDAQFEINSQKAKLKNHDIVFEERETGENIR